MKSVSMRMVTYAVLRWGVTVRCSADPIFYWCDQKCVRSTAARALGTAPHRCREACLACNTDQTECYVIQSDPAFLCTSSLTYCGKDNSMILLHVVCILDRKNNSKLEITISIKIVRLCNISIVIITKPGGTLVSMLELRENTWHIQVGLT